MPPKSAKAGAAKKSTKASRGADPADVETLTRKLRSKGLDDDQVRDGLQGLGFSRAQADKALGATAPPSQASPETGGGRSPGGAPSPTSTPPGQPAADPEPADDSSASKSGIFGGLSTPQVPSFGQVTLTPPKRLSGGDMGGFLAGLLLYTLALNFLRYGPDGPRGWFSAKFLNSPMEVAPSGTRLREPRGSGLTSTRPTTPTTV